MFFGSVAAMERESTHIADLESLTIESLNAFNDKGETLLTQAIKTNCDESIIKALIAHGADINLPNKNGHTPLVMAVQNSNLRIVEVLIHLGVHLDAWCETQIGTPRTALMLAITYGHNDIARAIATHKTCNPDLFDRKDRSALIHAILMDNYEMVKFLLNQNPNHSNKAQALLLAVKAERLDLVKLLFQDYDADINFTNDDNNDTALQCAAIKGNDEIVKLFLESGKAKKKNQTRALYKAIVKNPAAINIIQLLLEAKANPNIVDASEMNLLMYATQNGHEKIVRLLLEHNVDTTIVDNNRKTLMISAQAGHFTIFICLLSYYCDELGINSIDSNKNTALMHAAAAYCPQSITKLLNLSSDPHLRNNNNNTALLILSKLGDKNIHRNISMMIRNICFDAIHNRENFHNDNNIQDYFALNTAISKLSKDEPKPFKQLRIDLEERPSALALLETLIQSEKVKVGLCCSLILEKDPKTINHTDKNGYTPLMNAAKNNNSDVINVLLRYASDSDKKAAMKIASQNENTARQYSSKPKFEMCVLA